MRFLLSVLATLCASTAVVNAHSWLACADYRGSVEKYDESKCYAYPRNWESARGGFLAPDPNGYHIGGDSGYNYNPSENAACQFPKANPVDNGYTQKYPKAVYEQGKTYCLAWPMKNHGAAQCTNQYIPDTKFTLFRSAVNPGSDPTITQFKTNEVTHYFGKHQDGNIDCLGFQRSPKFCDNTDKAMGTGCFKVDDNQPLGHYVYQWYWEFNPGSVYTTCWDVQVVASGQGRGGGGVTGASGVVDNLHGVGTSGSICRNNWASAAPSLPAPVTPTNPDAGNNAPPTPADPDATVPVTGDTVKFSKVPATLLYTAKSGDKIKATVAYSATADRVIVVDVLTRLCDKGASWHGKGVAYVTAGSGFKEIEVTLDFAAGGLLQDAHTVLHTWIVDKAVFDDPQEDQPWTKEFDAESRTFALSTSTIYDTLREEPSSAVSVASSSLVVNALASMANMVAALF